MYLHPNNLQFVPILKIQRPFVSRLWTSTQYLTLVHISAFRVELGVSEGYSQNLFKFIRCCVLVGGQTVEKMNSLKKKKNLFPEAKLDLFLTNLHRLNHNHKITPLTKCQLCAAVYEFTGSVRVRGVELTFYDYIVWLLITLLLSSRFHVNLW